MKKRMSVILALTMAATTMFSAVPAMAKDGDEFLSKHISD